jgi:hypothetical protein
MLIDRHPPTETVERALAPILGAAAGMLLLFLAGSRYVEIERGLAAGSSERGAAAGAGPRDPSATPAPDGRLPASPLGYVPARLDRADATLLVPRKMTRAAAAEPRRPQAEIVLPPAEPTPHDLRIRHTAEPRAEAQPLGPVSMPLPPAELPPPDPPAAPGVPGVPGNS